MPLNKFIKMDKTETFNADWFLSSVFSASLEIDEKKQKLLEESALAFLRANGAIRWGDWQTLSPISRAAFAIAGMRLRTEEMSHLVEILINNGEKEPADADG